MSDIAAQLREVLPAGVSLAAESSAQPLWPGEHLPNATRKRLIEFATGRTAARQALQALGFAPVAIAMGADRAPQWPEGVTGSISHCAGACLAVAGLLEAYLGLGLDVEQSTALPEDIWETVLLPEERRKVAALEKAQQGLQALRIFVAKEAAYKAQYHLTHQIFDFQTIRIEWRDTGFAAEFQHTVNPFEKGFQIDGRMVENAQHVAAICWFVTG